MTRCPSVQRQRGFTLIEIMVVVIIIGFAATMATWAFGPDKNSEAKKAVEQFMRQARFISQQTVLTGEVVGLFVRVQTTRAGTQWCYRWQRFRDNSWQPVTDFLKEVCLNPSLDIDMVVEGEPYTYDPKKTTPKPVLMFYPSGEASPLKLAIYNRLNAGASDQDDAVQRVSIDMMGAIVWRNKEEQKRADREPEP